MKSLLKNKMTNLNQVEERQSKTSLENHKWKYRIGYASLKIFFICLLFEMENSSMYKKSIKDGEVILRWNGDMIFVFMIFILLSSVLFYSLQASDPGYLIQLSLEESESKEIEQLIGATIEQKASDNERRKHIVNQKKRIQEIELKLYKMETGEHTKEIEPDITEATNHADLNQHQQEECIFCEITPTLRSHHCRYCDRCVATYDHHCFCIGTCIGEKNHCRFWWFLLLGCIELTFAISITQSGFQSAPSLIEWLQKNYLPLCLGLIFSTTSLLVFPLLGFHSFLMLSNVTSYELGKGAEKLKYLAGTSDCDLPFSNGLIGNIKGFCCSRDGIWVPSRKPWQPTKWKPPGKIDRESDNIFDNIWENKYYSCC